MAGIERLDHVCSLTKYSAGPGTGSIENYFSSTSYCAAIGKLVFNHTREYAAYILTSSSTGTAMTAHGQRLSFRSGHLHRQSSFYLQLFRIKHGLSLKKDVKQGTQLIATPCEASCITIMLPRLGTRISRVHHRMYMTSSLKLL